MALLLSNAKASRRPSTLRIGLVIAPPCRHLGAADSTMRTLIARVGPCDLIPRRGAFAILCHSIISQQLSIS